MSRRRTMPECPHDRFLSVQVGVTDNLTVLWPNGKHTGGRTTPRIGGVIDQFGDVGMKVCIDCHKVLGMIPSGYLLAKMPQHEIRSVEVSDA
jgi:hypothetical protein